jgi:dihydroflavonol-4-reductase
MNALVTGATGFLGSHLCRRLVKDGFNVSAFCRPTSISNGLVDLPIERKFGDVSDRESVEKAVAGSDVVFHAASHGIYWGRHKEIQNRTNIEGTKNVVDACQQHGVKRLIFVSSITAIGIPSTAEPADENFTFNLERSSLNYHISKKRAEDIVQDAVANGLDAVIVNPSNIWGPHGENYRVADHVEKVRNRRLIPYFTGGICIVHVDDVVDGIMAAFHRGKAGERYILGGENLPLKSIAQLAASAQSLNPSFVPVPNFVTWLAAAVGESLALVSRRRPHITFVTHKLASRFQYYDSSKAKRELGFKARDFKSILAECVAFVEARNNGKGLTKQAKFNAT